MKDYLEKDPWKVIEKGFHPEHNLITESIMSIGNGYMGQRANFEEYYSGETMQGSYLAGIYYPDKTRVGWWKNGYPEYFAKVLNSVNWIGIDIYLGEERLDLAKLGIESFVRELDMKNSILRRTMVCVSKEGHRFRIGSERFCSRATRELGCIHYTISSENYSGPLTLDSYLDFDVYNQDANYDEQFWAHKADGVEGQHMYVQAETKKTGFEVHARAIHSMAYTGPVESKMYNSNKRAGQSFTFTLATGQTARLVKKAVIHSSFYIGTDHLAEAARSLLHDLEKETYSDLRTRHMDAWANLWKDSDIVIEGDVSAQQGIRFNIFHLHQTYSGEDARLNIGPKGFTGEKYGGSTYWDTEAYCIPFYLSNSDQEVSRNLLMYRYKHLGKAIENARKLGFSDGAALYPMVTMNGEECHNEWEITFEEIHRNGAIAYAIYDYTRYTADESYLIDFGIDVLVGIARFWSQRVNWSEARNKYVMLGVTGPNEYENNVNNNWYTNFLAVWCLKYTKACLDMMAESYPEKYTNKSTELRIKAGELERWMEIASNMYFPYDDKRQVYLQQDGFLDKELNGVETLDPSERPLNQNWSWDRILRSCYIKQADVLQGIYFFEEKFDLESIRRHFDFYEPLTVHESSLSPCVHAILACRIGYQEKAYEMYLRTARLDLDDYNNDTEDGLHITSMAGTWMAVVKGFAGMKIEDSVLSLEPFVPDSWSGFEFTIRFRGNHIRIKISKKLTEIHNLEGGDMALIVNKQRYRLLNNDHIQIN